MAMKGKLITKVNSMKRLATIGNRLYNPLGRSMVWQRRVVVIMIVIDKINVRRKFEWDI